MAYKTGNRMQTVLLPPIIDDYVSKEDPVRAYDAFVEALDFNELGLSLTDYKAGADEYYPKTMLKLIVYGYSYGIRSSRKLERACYHNLSFIWLMANLKPDYRTIARFRSDNKEAIKKVLKQCVRMCIELGLIEGNTLFIDGSSFRANASIKNTWSQERCLKHLDKLSSRIDQIVDESEQMDNNEENQESLVKLKKELTDKEQLKKKIQQIASYLKDTSKEQHNTTDSDSVITKGRQGTHAGYNAQLIVDEKHGLIVHSEALSSSPDANKFSGQTVKAVECLEKKPKVVSSDCGYYSLDDLAKVDKDITVVIPSLRQAQQDKGLHPLGPFGKELFAYDSNKDEYVCPEGKSLRYANDYSSRKGKPIKSYQASAQDCLACKHFGSCTSSSQGRIITRQPEEALKDELEDTYLSPQGQDIYRLRKQKVELPFGHIKSNLGAGQFLMRGKPKVDAELSILSTCFNLARMITLIGIPGLILRLSSA